MSAALKYVEAAALGLTAAQTARLLSVTPAAVTHAARRYGITFYRAAVAKPRGVQHQAPLGKWYPFRDLEVGDWFIPHSDPFTSVWCANKRLAPKVFKAHGAGWIERVK